MPLEQDPAIEILWEEPHFLLVNKPAGLLSQAAYPIDSLEARLAQQLKLRDAHPGRPFVGLPHRLDRGTSGVMLLAKNQRALKRFCQQFQSRKVKKFYLAVAEGDALPPSPGSKTLDWQDYLLKIPDKPLAEVVAPDASGAKLAVSIVQCLEREADLNLLLIQLVTGRMHQIRVQAASRGMPVLGDVTYGALHRLDAEIFSEPRNLSHPAKFAAPCHTARPQMAGPLERDLPLALHALRIEFRHPQTAKHISATATVPSSWGSLPQNIRARIDELTAHSRRKADQSWD